MSRIFFADVIHLIENNKNRSNNYIRIHALFFSGTKTELFGYNPDGHKINKCRLLLRTYQVPGTDI